MSASTSPMHANGINGHSSHPRPVIDMRSDTVTRPTPEMRAAMSTAEVGDDVYSDDPTVNRLQQLAAEMAGKEAALFVPSGTMGNLICVLTHCRERGDEYIVGDQAHIHYYEQGGTASLGSVHPRTVRTSPDGTLEVPLIEAAIRTLDDHFPITRLVCLENTHNRCGGRVLKPEYVASVSEVCKRHNLKLHIDGARLFNASVALKVPIATLLQHADSASLCLSKGLAAPIGSVIVGSKDFIFHCKRLRKALGGGMRQAGVIAAAAILSLTTMIDRLAIDHSNAQLLAKGLSTLEGLEVKADEVETNIVYVRINDGLFGLREVEVQRELKERGVWVGVTGVSVIRFVVHYEVTSDDVQRVVEMMRELGSRKKE